MASDILFPCRQCAGKPAYCPHCSYCKGTGKSDRQLLLDIQATQAQILELLQRPAPAPAPVRSRDSRLDIIGPGVWNQPKHPPFPNLTEEDKADLRARMDVARAERAKKGK